jgi:hypothetical protein
MPEPNINVNVDASGIVEQMYSINGPELKTILSALQPHAEKHQGMMIQQQYYYHQARNKSRGEYIDSALKSWISRYKSYATYTIRGILQHYSQ